MSQLVGFQEFMRPLLEFLARQPAPVRARDAYDQVADAMGLTQADRELILPSGTQRVFHNRIGWARSYLSSAGLVDCPTRGTWAISPSGRELLRSHAGPIDLRVLKKLPAYQQHLAASRSSDDDELDEASDDAAQSSETPEEQLFSAHRRILESVKEQLTAILQDEVDDATFESLVVDLLGKMGYGIDDSSRRKLGGTNDHGVDGVISLDRLGLERVYIQAKKWKHDHPVSPREVREFVGALDEKRATKGVFMTTSRYTREAIKYAEASTRSLILIDGARLVTLMIEHGVGVTTAHTLNVPRVDRDYFEE